MNEDNILTLYYWFLTERMKTRVEHKSIYAKWYKDSREIFNSEILVHSFPFLRLFMFEHIIDRKH